MTEGDILAPLLDTKYAEIRDQVIRDITLRAYFEACTPDLARAMQKVRPYLEGHPNRTVREAIALLRADLDATNHPQPASAGPHT